MIEFLSGQMKEVDIDICMRQHGVGYWENRGEDNQELFGAKDNLCDALWEAVKNKLINP